MVLDVDEVFKALADPTRRALLDELFREDGQTLVALEAHFDMTRFGVMKHLKQLEDAGLVVTKRRGREKLHFLNPVPIRLVHDRWVSKYAEPWTAALSELKQTLESTMEKVFEIYIRTTPEQLWEAITDPDNQFRPNYQFGNSIECDWQVGSRYEMGNKSVDQLYKPTSIGTWLRSFGRRDTFVFAWMIACVCDFPYWVIGHGLVIAAVNFSILVLHFTVFRSVRDA